MKANAFRLMDSVPFGGALYPLLQRCVTGRYYRNLALLEKTAAPYLRHMDACLRHGVDPARSVYLEFGAGSDLFGNLIAYCCGVPRQIVVDVRPLVQRDQVNHVIKFLRDHELAGLVRRPTRTLQGDVVEELQEHYGIQYLAPAALESVAASRAIDVIASTSTLEHLEPAKLEATMRQCHRLIREDGIVSMIVYYDDHYAHTDPSIGPYNFLRFSRRRWAAYSPPSHFQNRLRHCDYARMFRRAGFEILFEKSFAPASYDALLRSVELADEFRGYAFDELRPVYGEFVLKKA